ncbi:hypothetical protein [Hymenobacter arizonensis]|uniref:Lipoprotein n=1 Tax=Hymenobacter arizonensis TaxID=1227077 RepID=A0A1I6BNY4_HYMAR|nr:hypothetical protein [Hymenobacter arizonensis]SFQ82621.1 hypothetical protein SAMN04515668_4847 [Hymenobacter arizonensis]
MRFSHTLLAASFGLLLVACQSDHPAQNTGSMVPAAPTKEDSSGTREVPVAGKATDANGRASVPPTQRWRINDTLELECSRPIATFVTEEQATPQTVWNHLALRGRRGWYKLLADNMYWTLYHASVTPDGKLFQLPTVGAEDQLGRGRHRANKPLKLTEEELFYNTYDVPHRTWTEYLDEELNALPAREIDAEYLGGELNDKTYHPLPHWLTQEHTRLQRTRRLPPAEQVAAYLELSQDTARHTGRLVPPYRPLLANLLRAYQPYTTSPDTTRLLQEAVRSLTVSTSSKSK